MGQGEGPSRSMEAELIGYRDQTSDDQPEVEVEAPEGGGEEASQGMGCGRGAGESAAARVDRRSQRVGAGAGHLHPRDHERLQPPQQLPRQRLARRLARERSHLRPHRRFVAPDPLRERRLRRYHTGERSHVREHQSVQTPRRLPEPRLGRPFSEGVATRAAAAAVVVEAGEAPVGPGDKTLPATQASGGSPRAEVGHGHDHGLVPAVPELPRPRLARRHPGEGAHVRHHARVRPPRARRHRRVHRGRAQGWDGRREPGSVHRYKHLVVEPLVGLPSSRVPCHLSWTEAPESLVAPQAVEVVDLELLQ